MKQDIAITLIIIICFVLLIIPVKKWITPIIKFWQLVLVGKKKQRKQFIQTVEQDEVARWEV